MSEYLSITAYTGVRNSALCTKIHIFPQRGKSKVQNTESSEEQSDKMLEFV